VAGWGDVGVVVTSGIGLFWPGWGIVPRWRHATRTAERVRIEDTLKHLYDSEVNGVVPSIHSVAGAVHVSADEAAEVLQRLQGRRLIAMERDGIRLTASGRELGLHMLRAHRLWESYLADHTGSPSGTGERTTRQVVSGRDALSARCSIPSAIPAIPFPR
jgi:hypothetical protein